MVVAPFGRGPTSVRDDDGGRGSEGRAHVGCGAPALFQHHALGLARTRLVVRPGCPQTGRLLTGAVRIFPIEKEGEDFPFVNEGTVFLSITLSGAVIGLMDKVG